MRIVHVVRQFTPGVGGLENTVHDLCLHQVQAGHKVRVVTLDKLFGRPEAVLPRAETLQGIEVIRIPFRGSKRYPLAPSVIHHVGDADLVHVHAVDFFFDFLALTSFLHGRPMVLTPHGGFFHSSFAVRLKKLYFHTVTRLLIRSYRRVISLSEHDQQLFLAIRKQGLVWWDYGIDNEKFKAAAATEPTRRIITISRFSANKRHDRMFAFLAGLREREPGWMMTVVGSEFDFSADDLRVMAERAGVSDVVDFYIRPSNTEIRRLMSDCSVAVSASDYEGFGIAAVEAMSAGLIPVLSPLHSYRGIVKQARAGLIVDFSDPASAADAFLLYWREVGGIYPQIRDELIRASRSYDWAEVAARINSVYQEVLESPRAVIGPVVSSLSHDPE